MGEGGFQVGNLAYKINQTHKYQEEIDHSPKRKVATTRKARFTLGEKCLGLLFAGAVMFGATEIISNQIAIYTTNIEIQKVETAIDGQIKQNNDLYVQVKELSTYERIWGKAQELGLFLNEDNVKVVVD